VNVQRTILLLSTRALDGGERAVLAPAVGLWSGHPHGGALVGPGSKVGTLEVGNRRYDLVLPDGASGRVVGSVPRDRTVAVEYGEVLLVLAPVATGDAAAVGDDGTRLGHPGGVDLPEGARAVVAPTDGVFYARPSPEAPAFVAPGVRVRTGHVIGLIEVMKTFNQIPYGGPGFPEEAEVLEIRADDGGEVRAGQVLVVVR